MNKNKTKKNIRKLALISAGIKVPVIISIAAFLATSSGATKSNHLLNAQENNLHNQNTDISQSNNWTADINHGKDFTKKDNAKPVEPKVKTPKIENIVKTEPDKKNEYVPEKEDKIPSKPPVEDIEIQYENHNIKAKIQPLYKRNSYKSDREKGIENLRPYTHQVVPRITEIKVTDEIYKDNFGKVQGGLQNHITWNDLEIFKKEDTDKFKKVDYVKQNWDNYYRDKFFKFSRLFDTDNVKKFLTDDGQSKYDSFVSVEEAKKSQDKKIERYMQLFQYLDYSKFKELSKRAKEYLKKGEMTDPRNAYVDENGEIDSYTYSPINNQVTSRIRRDNKEFRVFGYDSEYNLTPDQALNNEIPGWHKTDDLSQTDEFKKYNIGQNYNDGIKIYRMKRNDPVSDKRNEGLVIEIDASNPIGYPKTLQFIRELNRDNVEVTQYRIKGMGKYNQNQDFIEIMKALPNKIPQLVLFLEGYRTDFMIHLENKEIDELNLYTTVNALSSSWSINPWSFKKTKWINTNDYNVSREYGKTQTITSRIVFNTLAFEESDARKTHDGKLDISRINDGLRMVYYVRNNEPIFQGNFGGGMDPDHSEHNNSYPTELDFSRVPLIKSLRGMIFYDEKHTERPHRKLKKLTLFNDKDFFEIPVAELNEANFSVMDTTSPPPPKTTIQFSNQNTTKQLKIIANPGETLTPEGINNLNILLSLAKDNFSTRSILVEDLKSSIVQQLKSMHKSVEEAADVEFT